MFKSNVTKAKAMETEQFKQFSLYEHKETITSCDTPTNLQTNEPTDEEIIKAAEDQATFAPSFIRGAQWYREQLKKK